MVIGWIPLENWKRWMKVEGNGWIQNGSMETDGSLGNNEKNG
jgi:hypothetical protein